MKTLKAFLLAEKAAGKRILPHGKEWFRALDLTPPDKVRVVILEQDPYHGPGKAHGLCFSAPPGVRPPPSLINIFKELESDVGVLRPRLGLLESWAKQSALLLLNSVLTVEMNRAASHQGRGWERFTDSESATSMRWTTRSCSCCGEITRRKKLLLSTVSTAAVGILS